MDQNKIFQSTDKYDFRTFFKSFAKLNIWHRLLGPTYTRYHLRANRIAWRRAVVALQNKKLSEIESDLTANKYADVFYCGDSHVELSANFITSNSFIDAGMMGATASSCLAMLDAIEINSKAEFSILIIGTNDIAFTKCLSGSSINKFRKDVLKIISKLRKCSNNVLISALPPAENRNALRRSPSAAELYSYHLQEICSENDCIYFDPFSQIRSNRFGVAISEVFHDGIHLSDYKILATNIEEAVNALRRSQVTAINDNHLDDVGDCASAAFL